MMMMMMMMSNSLLWVFYAGITTSQWFVGVIRVTLW